jgi:hypothetical protein
VRVRRREDEMDTSVLFIWAGALLVIGGLVFTASQAVRKGRLSGARPSPGQPTDTLEPPRNTGGFSLRENWPGLAIIVLGALLLLFGSAF